MLRSITAPLAAAILATAVIPSSAGAQACTGRPGASAIEQYCEAIPDGDGDRVTGSSSGSTGSSSQGGGVPISKGTAGALAAAGPDGKAVIGLLGRESATGSQGQKSKSGGSGNGTTASSQSDGSAQSRVAAAKSPSDNPLRAVSSAASDGATVGSMYLWGLLLLAVVALGAGWVGFRRNRGS